MTARWATTRRGLLLGSVAGAGGIGVGAPGVVLPDVASALGVTEDATAWIVAAFVLGTGIAMALGGRALDLLGSRHVLAAGMAATTIGTVAIALAPDFALIVVGRFVQGAGSGWLGITAFNAVSFLDRQDRARVGGVLTAVAFACIAAGPLIGALVNEVAGWRAVLCSAALALVFVPAVLRGVPRTLRAVGRLDLRGAAYATIASICVASILQSPSTNTPAPVVVVLLVVAAATIALLAAHLRRRPDGFMPMSVLRHRELIQLSVAAAMVHGAYAGLIFAAPLLLAREAGWSALQTGAALFPGAIIAAVVAHLAGTVGTRFRTPDVLLAFCALAAAGLLVVGLGRTGALVVAGTLLTVGPIAGAQAVMLGRVSTLVGDEDVGAATGTFTYVFITGGTLGVAAAGGLSSIISLEAAVALLVVLPLAGIAVALQVQAPAPQPVPA